MNKAPPGSTCAVALPKCTLYPTAADKAAAPQMPASYPQDAKAAAERRVVLAGYRLADALAAELLAGK